jgi:periplasmic divalent cation tolerance protein
MGGFERNHMNKDELLIVLCACPDPEAAISIAHTVVDEFLAACVNILPGIRSIYRWNDAVQDEPEALMILKTTVDRWPALQERLLALHPYEVPEVVAIPTAGGHDAYFQWVAAGTRTPNA